MTNFQIGLTWRRVWVVLGKVHDSLEVTVVIQRIGIQHDERDVPAKDVFIVQLI